MNNGKRPGTLHFEEYFFLFSSGSDGGLSGLKPELVDGQINASTVSNPEELESFGPQIC